MSTTVEFAGVKFTGGKIFVLLTALSTLAGGAWAGFEFYDDYRDMKAQIQSYTAPDLSGIREDMSVLREEIDRYRIRLHKPRTILATSRTICVMTWSESRRLLIK